MARLYADEQFPRSVVELLRELGHDVLTVQEAGCRADADPQVLAFARSENPCGDYFKSQGFFQTPPTGQSAWRYYCL